MAHIISPDEIKETLHGYKPEESEKFHQQSAKLADEAYHEALKQRSEDAVMLMSGGAASGKTEYVSEYLQNQDAIIVDGTLPTFKGAEIKINKALRQKKTVEIHAVIPTEFTIAFLAFLNRTRRFAAEHFYKTHSKSRRTLLKLAKEFPEITIKIIRSDYTDAPGSGANMLFQEITFENRQAMIEYLRKIQYTQEEIKEVIAEVNDT
jgi:hypothetical protein